LAVPIARLVVSGLGLGCGSKEGKSGNLSLAGWEGEIEYIKDSKDGMVYDGYPQQCPCLWLLVYFSHFYVFLFYLFVRRGVPSMPSFWTDEHGLLCLLAPGRMEPAMGTVENRETEGKKGIRSALQETQKVNDLF
jgi:hypothetical protein